MAKIVKVTQDKLYEMVEQSVLNVLNEGAKWEALKNVGKYFKDRIIDGQGKHKLGENPNDLRNFVSEYEKQQKNASNNNSETTNDNNEASQNKDF